MSKIELNKKYNSLQIKETDGKWTDFEQKPGSEVELFLKDKLEDSVVNFTYFNTGFEVPDTKEILNNVLVGYNAFGNVVCYERIINADPTYTYTFGFQNVTIGATPYQEGGTTIQVNKTDNLTASVTFSYLLTGSIAGSEFNEASPQTVTFKWFKDLQGDEVDVTLDTLTRTVTPGESITVDISKVFENAFSGRYLGMVFTLPKSTTEVVKVFATPFTLRKLVLSYAGNLLITTPTLTNIQLDGINEDLSDYSILYYLDNTTRLTQKLDGSTMTPSSIKLELPNLNEGAHDIFMRITDSLGKLTSNFIQVGFIYQKTSESTLTDAIAMVSEVPNEIDNCNLSKFFKVITTDKLSGNIEIVALKSSNYSNLANINTIEAAKSSRFLFKEISLNLLSTDPSLKIDYTSYIEVTGNEDSTEYLKILIKDGSPVPIRTTSYYLYTNSISKPSYKTITIKNPKEGSSHLQHTVGSILDFSQISNGNFFTDLSPNLDSADGLQLESVQENTEEVTLTTFKVSPNAGVFSTPKKLLSAGQVPLHKGNFSIEMMFKTYSIADLDDKIMTIGNITLCPKHLFINYKPEENSKPHHTVNASRADFRKEVLQHVVITYDPEYKPSTYEQLYDSLFTSGSVSYSTSAKAYPCFKVYVNGTINRIISVGSSTICSENDFKLQIHPSNSNINFYVFRTYDKTLNYEEVKKNRISAMSKLVDKRNYYLDNELLYLSTDFAASDVSKKSSIMNTISLGKCINKFRSVSNPTKQYKDRRVLLLVLPEGIKPPYYGNRKEDEPKAAFLVHYPETMENAANYSGRLSGGKVKALGSSAKKYMIHNTSYSKFKFTPESLFNVEAPQQYSYYKMPGSDIEIKKLVGKVNYASSMQSHKQGATKLFHEAYMSSGMDTSWMNGGRKAVLEDDFFYFFVNVPKDDLETITWDYFKQEDGTYNFEKCYFLGFQTWGSAKGDEKTSGYGDDTPHYLMLEGADNDNASANFKVPWAALQLWGNYTGNGWNSANSTVIEAPSDNPTIGKNYLHQFAGGTKVQDNIYTPEYLTGLLINDETIVFNPGTETETSSDKKADAWDVDFGFTEGEGYVEKGNWYLDGEEVEADTPGAVKADDDNLFFVFEDGVKDNVNRFALFYNLVYTFDFSSFLYIPHGTKDFDGESMEVYGKPSYLYKLIFGPDCTIKYKSTGKTVTPKAGDIYRWDKAWPSDVKKDSVARWVPGGLYYNTTPNINEWESLNITQICTWYSNAAKELGTYPAEYSFFSKPDYETLKAKEGQSYKYILDGGVYEFSGYDDAEGEIRSMQACMAEAFKIVCHEFLDVEDVSYHSAFIKLVAGTDNRAKNTYFLIVGEIYTDKATVDGFEEEVSLVKIKSDDEHNKKPGFIKDGIFYTVTVDSDKKVTITEETFDANSIKETKKYYYKKTGLGDNKIRLYADDLDTIFKTDNNGQQVKPYYLMEPPFNTDLEELWGDMHSGFFYNFDLTFTSEVKAQLGKLLNFLTGNLWPDNPTTKAYDYFFSIQEAIPSIAYNHQSEIYYESALVFWQDEKATAFYDVFVKSGVKSWADFNNNKVANPVSLSHGSCLEAEIEYMRDRVLLLSTYTNTAKKETDTGILLSGGSATTQGKEVTIASEYTSFILYIYPIINNIQSFKTTTSLLYDPLLDYVSWDNVSNYNKIDLAYNIALPNEPLDMSVTFTHSPLTTQAYWTSTDLYRTIHIKSGTEAFGSLFSFPNASTVISLDSAYNISIAENKEIEVVDHLEGIEHLVLQNASIGSSGLDFTGCNRLKTLVLGSTEDTLTDSPEGTPSEDMEWYAVKFKDVLDPLKYVKVQQAGASTGFQQVILPKSNSIEQVILPNCVKIANINYYPNLVRLEFNDGTLLTNLTIDGRNSNSIIEYLITNFIGTYTTNLEITNIPSNFWLSEESCRKLAQIANVKIVGKINIGDGVNLKNIDWTTRKLLVEKFGNIDFGTLTFDYKKVSITNPEELIKVNATGSIESSGAAPLLLSITGNGIPIDTSSDAKSKRLKIYYSIKDENGNVPSADDIRFVNKWTPLLIIKEGLKGVYTITTLVYYTNSSSYPVTTKLTVGFYAPKVGDFAYANGVFSPVYDSSLGMVGIVFYSKASTNAEGKTVYDVRVLSKDFSSTNLPLSASNYASDWTAGHSIKTRQTLYLTLLSDLGLQPDIYLMDVTLTREGGTAQGQITYDKKWNDIDSELYLHDLPNTKEHQFQKEYINRASQYLNKLYILDVPQVSISSLESYGWTKPTLEGKARYELALEELRSKNFVQLSATSSYTKLECGNFLYGLFPAFLSALYYQPSWDNIELSGKGVDYFGIGNWYVPDTREMERLIYYRINSSILNKASTELAWNNTKATGVDVSKKELNVFSVDAFSYIAFLGDNGPQITSETFEDGEGYTYCLSTAYGQTDPQWNMTCHEYYDKYCARDIEHNISPVCRIELIES